MELKTCIESHTNDENLAEVHFEHFFPRAKGHAKLIYEFHSSRISPFCSSVKNDEIELHLPDHVDLDYLAQKCYLKMIASASEA